MRRYEMADFVQGNKLKDYPLTDRLEMDDPTVKLHNERALSTPGLKLQTRSFPPAPKPADPKRPKSKYEIESDQKQMEGRAKILAIGLDLNSIYMNTDEDDCNEVLSICLRLSCALLESKPRQMPTFDLPDEVWQPFPISLDQENEDDDVSGCYRKMEEWLDDVVGLCVVSSKFKLPPLVYKVLFDGDYGNDLLDQTHVDEEEPCSDASAALLVLPGGDDIAHRQPPISSRFHLDSSGQICFTAQEARLASDWIEQEGIIELVKSRIKTTDFRLPQETQKVASMFRNSQSYGNFRAVLVSGVCLMP